MPRTPDYLVHDPTADSSVCLSFAADSCFTVWAVRNPSQDTDLEMRLSIAPHRPVVIGRAEGHDVPYLDPAYRATRVVPGTGQCVVRSNGDERDIYVSRGHFLLRADPEGIVLVNGVPCRGGGLRPPRNGTRLSYPIARELEPEEAYLIGHGRAAVFRLPNGAEIRIDAE